LRVNREHPLWTNLNRLVVITSALLLLKLVAYFFQEFLPIFGNVVNKLFTAFLPFIFALLIAYLLEPLVVRSMRYLHLKRGYAALLTLIMAMAVVALFVFLLAARLYTELSELSVSLPNYTYVVNFLTDQIKAIEKVIDLNPQVQSTIYASTESLMSSVQAWATTGSVYILNLLASLPGFFMVLIITIVATWLVSVSFPGVKRFIAGLFPESWEKNTQAVSKDLGAAIVGFLRAESILISVTMFISAAGLSLMGNRYAVTLGILSGLLDLLPIVGTGMLYVTWAIVLFLMGSVSEGVKILLLWVVIIVVRQSLEPRIMSKNIGLHPLATLTSMYVGLRLLGGWGLIIGPTLVIIYEALRKAGAFRGKRV